MVRLRINTDDDRRNRLSQKISKEVPDMKWIYQRVKILVEIMEKVGRC